MLHPSTVAILGRRGAGKSATAYRLLELLRDRAAPCVVGPESLKRLLPEWIGVVATLDEAPSNTVVLVDEAYLLIARAGELDRCGSDDRGRHQPEQAAEPDAHLCGARGQAARRHMRDVEHLSYGEIARRTGLPKSTVWDLINGEGRRAD